MMVRWVILFYLWAILPQEAFGQTGESHLEKGLEYFDNLHYEKAIPELREAIRLGLSEKDDRIIAHEFLAFSYIVEGETEQAKIHFKEILRVDPKFRMDPDLSPKFLTIFDEVAGKRDGKVKKEKKKTLWYILGGTAVAGAATGILLATGGGEEEIPRIPEPPPPP